MTDFDADNLIRPGHRISEPIAQAWIAGVTGGIVVAVIVSLVAYSSGNLSAVPAPNPSAVYQTVPIASTTAPAPPPELGD